MNIYHRLIQKYLELHRKSKTLRRFRMGLAVIVVFATVYQLILPSLTMTKKAANEKAGIDIGSEKVKVLDCGLKVHHHDKSCYKKIDGKKVLVCGQADYVIHEHDDSCYAVDENGEKTLVCKLPEIKAHKHDKDCYEEELVLVCDKEEREGHEHTDECYEEETKLVCDKDEHTHDEDCYEEVEDEDGNITRELVCDKKEHEHDDDCYKTTRKLICDKKEEEGHTHSDKCYETKKVLTCGEAELHEHTKKCYEKGHNGDPEYLICEKLELKEHSHGKKCFDIVKTEKKSEDKEKDEEKKEDKEKEEVEAEKEETKEEETIVVETEAEEQDSSEEYVETETDTASIESTDENSEETEIEDTEQEEEEEEKDTEDKEDANEDDDENESSVKEIKFSRRLSDSTGIWRRYDDGRWTRVKASTILSRNENLMVRIAYVIPEGTLSEDNAYIVYKLPENLGATQVTADRINDDDNKLNQIMEGSRLPNDEKSGDENLAGRYEMVYDGEDENGVDRFSLALQFNDYTIEENASADVEGWLMFYLREIALPTDEDGNGKIVFSKKAADGKELAVSYKVDAEETQDAEEQDEQAETEEPQTEETNETEEESEAPVDITKGITYPALNLEASSETVTVSVQAEEGALPLGTTMIVEDVQDEGILNSIRDAASGEEASVEVKYVQAVDITFFDKTGREIEPLKPVRVSITCPEDNKSEDALVMHVDKEGTVQAVEQVDKEELIVSPAENEYIFDADSFSVYAVVGMETISVKVISDAGDTYKISVIYNSDANIPEGAWLEVREISEGTEEYADYLSRAGESLGIKTKDTEVTEVKETVQTEEGINVFDLPKMEDGDFDESDIIDGIVFKTTEDSVGQSIAFARFFDIRIMTDEGEIEPDAPVEVKIEYEDPVVIEDGSALQAVHFADDGIEVIDIEHAESTINTMVFDQASFSVTGTVLTVNQNWSNLSNGQQYVMYYTRNNNTYAIKRDGTLTQVTLSGTNLTFPNATSLNDLNDYLWTYSNTNGNRISYQSGGSTTCLDPTVNNSNCISQNVRNLSRSNDGRISAASGNNTYYIGSNNTNTNLTRTSNNGISIQFANAFAVDTPRAVTVHFVNRDGDPLTDVNYTGNYSNYVTKNSDGTFTILYNWSGTVGNVSFSNDFTKQGYTYANSHLAGTRPNNEVLTHEGLAIDSYVSSTGNALNMRTETGAASGTHPMSTVNLNNAIRVQKKQDNTDATQNTFVNYAAEGNKDIYVVLDPVASGTTPGPDGSTLDADDPKFKKILDSNDDGTYTLSLSVTGKANNVTTDPKANILIIVDTSSSMVTNTAAYADPQPPAAQQKNRLEETKTALKTLAHSLLENNEGDTDPDNPTIELSMISFDGGVVEELDWSADESAFDSTVDDLTVHRGTDWEDALTAGYEKILLKKASEPDQQTFVIFFTDGESSQYTNFNGTGTFNQNGYNNTGHYSWWYNYQLCGWNCRDEMRSIINAGVTLYGIFAYGSKTDHTYSNFLHDMVKYGHGTAQSLEDKYFFDASDTEKLNDAFDLILSSINSSVGFSDVIMNDSMTSLTSVGISTIHTSGTTGIKYYRSGGSYGNKTEWTDIPDEYKATYDDTGIHWDLGDLVLENDVTYTLECIVWPSQNAYDWIADLNNGVKTWDDVLAAGLNSQLVRLGTEPNYTYELKSNPDSYDATTGEIINNKITFKKTQAVTLESLPDGVVVDTTYQGTDSDGNRTETTYTYDSVTKLYTKTVITYKESAFGPPDENMPLTDTEFAVEKKWVVDLDKKQLVYFLYDTRNPSPNSKEITIPFEIYRDKEPDIYDTVPLGWIDGEYHWADTTEDINIDGTDYPIGTLWREDFNIAVGVMLDEAHAIERGIDLEDEKYVKVTYTREVGDGDDVHEVEEIYYVLERGHDYKIDEPDYIQNDYHFDFDTETYHPMLVNGKMKSVIIDYDTKTVTSITPEETNLTALRGTNTLRGGINLFKRLQDMHGNLIEDNIPDSEFEFVITLYNESGIFENNDDVPWYSVNDHYYHDNDWNYGDEGEGYTGNTLTVSDDKKSATATVKIKATDELRFINVPAGTTYTITEHETIGYEFVSVVKNVYGFDDVTITDSPEMTGEIIPNAANNVTFTNKQKPSFEVIVLKENQSGNILPGAKFSLYGADYYIIDSETGQPTEEINDRAEALQTDLISGADGKITLGKLTEGVYYLVETEAPAGFIKLEDPIVITVDPDSTVTKTQGEVSVPLYVTYSQKNNPSSTNNEGISVEITTVDDITTYIYTLQVINDEGVELPHTGGPGTLLYTLGGLIMMMAAALMVGLRMRDEQSNY